MPSSYNKLFQLIDKKLHKSPTGNFNQNIDYAYIIRGWITGINNADTLSKVSDPNPDLFAERLSYKTVESGLGNTPFFNGNISAQVWNNGSIGAPDIMKQGYSYAYDAVNRITAGDYKTFGTIWADATKYEERGICYDFNGNIKTLTRSDCRLKSPIIQAFYLAISP